MTQPVNHALDTQLGNLRRKLNDLLIAFPQIGRLRESPRPDEILRLADSVESRIGLVLQAVSVLRYEAHREMERLKGAA
jgi:hypothetical protein